ncbi:MAG: hypothetical protein ABNH17_07400 [Paracoccus sp. (in: a-proteobacteria)]|uniref:hypothetical protein n=1 Tax=Paracoccus sp. TaxID=267 RepID=UPI0032D97D59
MTTVYFSGGTTAAVTNLRGDDRVRFDIASTSTTTFHSAFSRNETLRFSENGPVYLLTRMSMTEGEAVLQVRRAR